MNRFIKHTITIGFMCLCVLSQNSCTPQDDTTSYQIGETITFGENSSVVMDIIEVDDSTFVVTEDAYIYRSINNDEWLPVVTPTDYSSLREVYGIGNKLYIVSNDWIDTHAQRLYIFDIETNQYEFAMYIKNHHYANDTFCVVQDRVGGKLNNVYYATETTNNLISVKLEASSYNYVSDNIWIDDEKNIHFYVDASTVTTASALGTDIPNMQEIIWSVEQSRDITQY